MRIPTVSDFVLQRVVRHSDQPLNRQIYQVLREAVLDRVLPCGLQLPSSRDLAKELDMSRNTVTFAYSQLMAEGYLETRTGAGTFIADTLPDQVPDSPHLGTLANSVPEYLGLSRRGIDLVAQAGAYSLQWGAFMPGVPDVSQFPNRVWCRLQNKYWRRSRPDLLTYGHGGGYKPLKEAIADYLRVVRSVNCEADQVIITSGIHQSIDLASKLLGEVGDAVWVEDPCYWGTRSILRSLNLMLMPMPVDAEGMEIHTGELARPPKFIVVTPSHQYPLGPVMSLARRRTLLEVAAASNAWVIEDDYDSEFRYKSRPLASLQGMDTYGRVLYMGSFSKTLFPGLRLGFLVVPKALAPAFAIGLSDLYREGQLLTQAVLADFIAEGHFASHIRRMKLVYEERLSLLHAAIVESFGESAQISGGEAGLHLTLGLPDSCDDELISRRALAERIIARPLSRYYFHPSTARRGLLLGYACVPNEQIGPLFRKLAAIIVENLPG